MPPHGGSRPRGPALIVVCGPPGSGKTTAVAAIKAALAHVGVARMTVVDEGSVRRAKAVAHAGERRREEKRRDESGAT